MNAIEIENLEFRYLGSKKVALTIPFFSVSEGESVLITGKSGSGKSTLVQCINGIIPHIINGSRKGEVYIFKEPISKTRVPDISRVVGTLLQDPERQIMNYKVEEEIAFGPENFNLDRGVILQRMEDVIDAVGIGLLRGRETTKLSGGEMQRVALASVLSMDPRILILDEPTSNIDPEGTREIFKFLKNEKGKRTMIIVEHKVERVLPFVDRIVVVDNGRIVLDGPTSSLIEEAHNLIDLGIEIPTHILLANKLGIAAHDLDEVKRIARERGMLPRERIRSTGTPIVFQAEISVSYNESFSLGTELSSRAGTVHAIMGRNGAGKSTLLKGIVGFIDKDQATTKVVMEIEGQKLINPKIQLSGRYLGYLPQSFDLMLVNTTVEKELNYSKRVRKLDGVDSLIETLKGILSLSDYAKSDPLTLSQGQRRRVAMASMLASGAKIILMDEPTSGQDYMHKQNLGRELAQLKQAGYTFIIVTHDSRFVYEFADWVTVMDFGKIVLQGTPESVFANSEMYGIVPPSEFTLRYENELLVS